MRAAVLVMLIFVNLIFVNLPMATASEDWRENFRLGVGVMTGFNNRRSDNEENAFPLIGFSARAALASGLWDYGLFTSGKWTREKDATYSVDAVTAFGDFTTRQVIYGFSVQRFINEQIGEQGGERINRNGQYVHFAVLLAANEVHVDVDDPNNNRRVVGPFGEDNEMFLRGHGMQLGYGQVFRDKWFWQLSYQWINYDRGLIIVRTNTVNATLFNGNLRKDLQEQALLLSAGIYSFF